MSLVIYVGFEKDGEYWKVKAIPGDSTTMVDHPVLPPEGSGSSRDATRALAYALEELAKKILEESR